MSRDWCGKERPQGKMFLPFSSLHLLPVLPSQNIFVLRGCSLVRHDPVTGRQVTWEGLKVKTLQVDLQK